MTLLWAGFFTVLYVALFSGFDYFWPKNRRKKVLAFIDEINPVVIYHKESEPILQDDIIEGTLWLWEDCLRLWVFIGGNWEELLPADARSYLKLREKWVPRRR